MKSTTLLLKQDGSKPDNLCTYRYTPVSHGTTVYVEMPPTYNIYAGSRRCVIVSQPLQEVATDVHDVQLSTTDNTFHIYGIGLKRNRMIQAHSQNGNLIRVPKMGSLLNRNLK